MKVLFISAWWPSRQFPTHGNFVQKHARLVARRHELTVLAVQEDRGMAGGRRILEVSEEFDYRVVQVYYGRAAATPQWLNLWNRSRAYLVGLQKVLHLAGKPDILHGHVLVDGGIAAALLGHRYGIPHLITEHSVMYRKPAVLSGARQLLAKWATRTAAYVLPVSDRLGQDMQALSGLRGNYTTVPNVVKTELFDLAPAWREGESFRFLHVSNFDAWQKNPAGLLRTFARMGKDCPYPFTVQIAGDGDRRFIEGLIEEYGLDRQRFVVSGPHTEGEIASLMQSHHALVLFSNYETQGVVLLEALVSGLPCIATRVGGVPDVIWEGENGFMVEPGDERALAGVLVKVIRNYHCFDRRGFAKSAAAKYGEDAVLCAIDRLYRLSLSGGSLSI